MLNIEIGIWKIEDSIIRCTENENVSRYINGRDVNESRHISQTTFWALPVHVALKDWSSLKDMEDLMIAMAIMRNNLNLPQDNEVDLHTWQIVKAIVLTRNFDDAA